MASILLEQLKVSQHQNDNSSGLISELQGMFLSISDSGLIQENPTLFGHL